MLLQTYLSVNSLTQAELADHLCKRPQTVWRWCHGLVVPPRDDIIRIYVWTNGQVRPDDFYDLPDLASADDGAAPPAPSGPEEGLAPPASSGPTPLEIAIEAAA